MSHFRENQFNIFFELFKRSHPNTNDNKEAEIREDISAITKSDGSSAPVTEEWADFDAFISAESAKDTSGDKSLENMLNDPWGGAASSATETNNAQETKAEEGDKNWANFDSFN
jgi:hypothetical protein